jgi:GT2 family glycosyltransferase
MQKYGVVIIGRNEGDRLVKCLESLADQLVVYVDSGSTDDSITHGKSYGAEIVELDMALPFTAARARNAGVECLLARYPHLEFVQFIDGDCQMAPGWLETARRALELDCSLASVCGRRRELNRGGSVYNLLCDMEWATPVGMVEACGGDAMYRVSAFRDAGQFDEDFIAGEEPELCFRLRSAGWRIRRVDADMTTHDANIRAFNQWWRRSKRSGYAFALGALEHGFGSEHYKIKPCLSVLFWAGLLPATALCLTLVNPWVAVPGLLLSYTCLGGRVYRHSRRQRPGFSQRQTALYATFIVLQKFPEFAGILQCGWEHMMRRRIGIIEYK